jgi:protease-4
MRIFLFFTNFGCVILANGNKINKLHFMGCNSLFQRGLFMPKLQKALLFFTVIIYSHTLFSQTASNYYQQTRFLTAPATLSYQGLLGFANPANVATLQDFNFRYFWQGKPSDTSTPDSWGVFTAVPNFGFGAVRNGFGSLKATIYRYSIAGGDQRFAMGIAFQKVTGQKKILGLNNQFGLGTILRPNRYIAIGFSGNIITGKSDKFGALEVGYRPLGDFRLTLFADGTMNNRESLRKLNWSAGTAIQLFSGLQIVGRYFDDGAFTVGIRVGFGSAAAGMQSHLDKNGNQRYNTYHLSIGEESGNLLDLMFRGKNYITLSLKGRVDYLTYRFFDDETQRLLNILQQLETIRFDNRISLVAINLSGMRILPEHAWEIREAVKALQEDGKKILVYIDNANMSVYHLASVADYIMMDPQGSLMLPGYVFGRTYLKGTLDKLGLAFDEWRFFKYKSAAEVLARDKMSRADREQRQQLSDSFYNLVKADVCEGRSLSKTQFDHLIDNHVYFTAENALAQELVDTLARWDHLDDIITQVAGSSLSGLPNSMIRDQRQPIDDWRTTPQIAVVYALGECAMDTGIRARWLKDVFRSLAKNKDVKAIVFRVDSPGGDGMASDLVAEALKFAAEYKPVVVSQGQVAASGGYWISMYGDTIVAAPNTITGSIGVIGGWLYNNGFAEKLGMSADFVKTGQHADLGFGVTLPLLGITVPHRNLDKEERAAVQQIFMEMYETFVRKVSEGRGLDVEHVKEIAQGRVWSGPDAAENGLIDEIGGLNFAIYLARQMAEIDESTFLEIREYPETKGLFRSNAFSPLQWYSINNDATIRFIKMMSEKNGYPMPLLMPGNYPDIQ